MKYNDLKISVLENAGYISCEEKEIIVSESSGDNPKQKYIALIGGVIVAAAATLGAIAAFDNAKVKKIINSHDELKKLNTNIKDTKDEIVGIRKALSYELKYYNKLCTDTARLASMFGMRTKEVYDGFYQYNETIINKYRTEANPDYDPEKAAEWAKASANAAIAADKINDLRSDLKKELKKMKTYNKELKSLAKKYATASPDAVDRLNKCIEKSNEEIDASLRDLSDFITTTPHMLESVDDLKLEIFESCYNNEITEEERDILLSMI